MMRFTIRDWLWLTAVVVVGAVGFVTRSGRENGRRTATRHVSAEESKAINLRYAAAKAEFEFQSSQVYGRTPAPSDICVTIERFAQAAEERDDLEARIKDLAAALEYAQHKASSTLDKYENDVEPANAVYRFQYTRADIEARLRRAEQDLAAAQATR